MIYLILSILSSTFILIIFKLFDKYGVNNLFAIITNYVVAGSLGWLLSGQKYSITEIAAQEWLFGAIGIGFMFITLFQIMALTAQKFGVARVSVAVKMSIALPVLAGIWLYDEKLSSIAIVGVVLALVAVYFGTRKKQDNQVKVGKWLIILPIILFFGDGMIGVLMKYAQFNWLQPDEMGIFSGALFGFAFLWGLLFLLYQVLIKKKYPSLRDLIGGVALGIPNFGSIYFLLLALDKSGLASASIFPINNVAIVGLSALIGLFAFKERLTKLNVFGLFCGVVSIILIAYG